MASEWPNVRIEDIAEKIAMGPFGSSIKVETFVNDGIPIISGAHLSGFRVEDGKFNFITLAHADKLKNANVRRGDVIFTHAGNIGQVAYIPRNSKFERYVISQRQFYLRCNPDKADPAFITYFFHGSAGRHQLLANKSQVGVPSISRPTSNLKTIEVPLPSLDEQRAIAGFLDGLEDRIDNLRATNATLEAIAQALFKSWFVDFDPVHAKAEGRAPPGRDAATAALFPSEFEDSELGLIPKGWRVSSVGGEFEVTMGQSPPGNTYNEAGEGIAFYQGRTDFAFRFPSERIFCTAPTRFAKRGDVLVSVRAPVGDINVAMNDCAVGRGVAAVRSTHQSFALYATKALRPQFASFESEGTVFGSINKKQLHALPLVMPTGDVLLAFESMVAAMDARIEVNEHQIRSLCDLRDTLLPRLISGKPRLPEVTEAAEATLA